MRNLLSNLGLTAVAVMLFLGLCEAVLWVVAPPPKIGLAKDMFANPDGLWRLTPNYSGIMDNRVDFRGKRVTADAEGVRVVPAAPAEAAHRLFAIGDSQTFGHGLSDDESWPNQVQLALGSTVKVENHGVPAINVDQYIRRLDHLLPRLAAGDTVLVGVSWNDLITPQEISGADIRVIDGYLVKAGEESKDAQSSRIKLYEQTGLFVPPLTDLKDFFEGLSTSSALMHQLYPRAKAIYYRLRDHRPVDRLVALGVPEANLILLAGMRTKVEARKARFVVVLLPDKIFFEDNAWRAYSAGGRDYPAQNLMGHLARPLCDRFELRCVDSFETLHAHQNDPVAFADDGHYNEAGARLIGQWLARQLGP